jgi:hypothetical protein
MPSPNIAKMKTKINPKRGSRYKIVLNVCRTFDMPNHLSDKMRTIWPSVFKKPEIILELRSLSNNFVLIPGDKASNNIVFVSRYYNLTILQNRLTVPLAKLLKAITE